MLRVILRFIKQNRSSFNISDLASRPETIEHGLRDFCDRHKDRESNILSFCTRALVISDSELGELKHRSQVLSFNPALEHENAPLSESSIRGTPIDPVEIIAMLGSIASVAQVILMVADMWSRKAKGKIVRKAKQERTHAWDEVKEIRVMMSDGTSIQFESWLAAPEKVTSFVETFHLPSQSPKPLWVLFLLKNSTHVRVDVSEGAANHHELETFIDYLKL